MIIQADCIEFAQAIPASSIDLVIVDPPYFEIIDEAWDAQWADEDQYLAWCRQWLQECVRVLKPNRCLYIWGTTKTDTFLRLKLQVLNCLPEMTYQNWIIWSYDWGGRTKKSFGRKHEDLLMYAKGTEFLFNDDEVRVPYKMSKNVRKGVTQNELGKIPTDVWMQNNHTTSKEYVTWHPTQKPLAFLERIIWAHTYPGDTVLDLFSGSGSTAIACDITGRRFKGCDISEHYVKQSIARREAWNQAPVSDELIEV